MGSVLAFQWLLDWLPWSGTWVFRSPPFLAWLKLTVLYELVNLAPGDPCPFSSMASVSIGVQFPMP